MQSLLPIYSSICITDQVKGLCLWCRQLSLNGSAPRDTVLEIYIILDDSRKRVILIRVDVISCLKNNVGQ